MTKIYVYNTHSDKEMAELFLQLYNGCIKYKNEKIKKTTKSIECDEYYNKYKFFSNKDQDSN